MSEEKKKKQYPSARSRIKREKAVFLEQLRKTPLIEVACKKIGISRSTVYRWKKDDLVFQKQFDEALYYGQETTNDVVESALMKGIQSGDVRLIKFYLQNRHPAYNSRAYQDRRKREERLGIADDLELSSETIARIDRLSDDMDRYLGQFKNVGLVKTDDPSDSTQNHQ